MPEIKLHLDDPSLALDALEVAQADARHEQDTASVTVLADLRAQIAAQLPKAPVEEPTAFGSVVRAGFDEYSDRILWQRGPKGGWTGEGGAYQGFFGALHRPEVLRVGIGEPTPEQVEADLAQDEQAHARYYAQPGVPVESVREVAETLLSLANAPEYQQPKYDDVNAVWRQAAQRVAALLPEEPTS